MEDDTGDYEIPREVTFNLVTDNDNDRERSQYNEGIDPKSEDDEATAATSIGSLGKLLMIYICKFHVLSNLLLNYICKLHWNLNTMFVCQVNYF